MLRLRVCLVFAVLLAGFLAETYAGWGARCAPVDVPAFSPPRLPEWQWVSREGKDYLYRRGVQVGGWDPEAKAYRDYDAATDSWSAPTRPPWEPKRTNCPCPDGCPCPADPCRCPRAEGKPDDLLKNPGVRTDLLGLHGEEYRLNGVMIPRDRAKRLVAAPDGKIPDDSAWLRLTLIGAEAECNAVLKDLAAAPELAPHKAGLVVQSYRPDSWAVGRVGFKTDGAPTIYVQAPDGQVLHRQDTYQGAEQLAEAVRKAKDYDAKKDPNLTRPAVLPALPAPVWALLAIFGVAIFWKKT